MPWRTQTAMVEPKTANLQIYRDPEVVSHYAALEYLTACEKFIFDTYLTPGMAILDLGVGGGRTTAYLSQRATRYVGVDYSEEMIRRCREKFPQREFLVADASDLSKFSDGSFDAIVFAFNGLDYLQPVEKRRQCLRECERIVRRGGVLIFSSHNPRSILMRADWDPQIVRTLAQQWFPRKSIGFSAALCTLTMAKVVHAWLRAVAGSAARISRRVPTSTFWRGEGCLIDSAHGGLDTHYSMPSRVREELTQFNFRQETWLGNEHPKVSHEFLTDWYYYVFTKVENAAGEPCA
jgi:ubiquinone/menaquinone biosynthesis C-methylase UbiE